MLYRKLFPTHEKIEKQPLKKQNFSINTSARKNNPQFTSFVTPKNESMSLFFKFSVICFSIVSAIAQSKVHLPIDTCIVKNFSGTFNGKRLNYRAITGMQPVFDASGKAIATLHYTYYQSLDHKDMSTRPLLISFNGGPGSASVWMHIAYTGPVLLQMDDEGFPIQPYGIKENPFSVLDVTDILYVNPVNTGFSRMIPQDGEGVKREQFFGINADIKYLAAWIQHFVSRNNRWLSPKYLIGESYGGTRVSGLAYQLQSAHWMYLNGVILVSPADYKYFDSDAPISEALNLPYFTATAWYHKKLPPSLQNMSLVDALERSEKYTLKYYMTAITRIGSLNALERIIIADSLAFYTGLDKNEILQSNLIISKNLFWKALLRNDKGLTIGRLDSRYLGLDKQDVGTAPDYNVELSHWLHAFTPSINYYLREVLGFKTELQYNMFGDVHPWDRSNNNTREQLRQAMAQNPYLHVLFQIGYYDGGTTYFNAKYTAWQMDPSGKLSDRIRFHAYECGHMMYLRKQDLKASNQHLREFIEATKIHKKPAKYE
jgi:carboxypeptidase C (cathepsin A)